MPQVADVLWKRLDERIHLGVDATTRYELNDWKRPLYTEDFEKDTPYNTRRNYGLPPTAISNPGLPAIKAAIFPEETPYYYYLHDRKGQIHFAKDLDAAIQELLDVLDGIAPRQMLLYLYTDPPSAIAGPDPLFNDFFSELQGLGNYPQNLRKIAVSDGSGHATNQGYQAGDQVIEYEYSSFSLTSRQMSGLLKMGVQVRSWKGWQISHLLLTSRRM
jgi:hypothetical protein